MAFSATLTPPSGLALASIYQGGSGATYTPSGGQLVVTDERDARALIDRGWTVTSIVGG